MKTLSFMLLAIFSLGAVSHAAEHKRVAIKKVIAAIAEDPEKALKEYALFTSRFEVVPEKTNGGHKGTVVNTSLSTISNELISGGKKYKFSCKLELFKTKTGTEKVRVRITKIL